MLATHPHLSRRDDAPAFDPKMFYTLSPFAQPKSSLSAGISPSPNGAVNVTALGAYSSENWQLFSQSGRYFIRNYDYGATWQLGVTDDNRSVPKLYPRSGSINQQWTLNTVDGGFELSNGLWGSGAVFAFPSGSSLPAMRSEPGGGVWNITSNPSAVKVKALTGDSLSEVPGFQNPSPSPTPSASSATVSVSATASIPSNTISSTNSQLPASTSNTSITSSTSPTSTPSSGLAPGAIAGIAIGVVALLGALVFALWFFLVKKRKTSKQHGTPYEVDGAPGVSEKYAYHAASELATPPAELAAKERETMVNRSEMDSNYANMDSNYAAKQQWTERR